GDRRIPMELIKRGLRVELGDCVIQNGLLLHRGRIWIPDNAELRTKILDSWHKSLPTGHAGRITIYER
ncbi:hypothetical protein M501DRAFT_904652, partial [Patellaria atrata CBS 101060]